MQTYIIVIFGVYFVFLIFLFVGWYRISRPRTSSSLSGFISVIVPFRNEAPLLPALVESLAHQQMEMEKVELIFVNDHSTDNSVEILSTLKSDNPTLDIQLHTSALEGKKQALTTGILKAKGDIILTTDADCVLSPEWIRTMVATFDAETKMVVGVVHLSASSFFGKLQATEFLSVLGAGLAALGWNTPLMCNGASLGFKKEVFVKVNGYEGNDHIPSGDDEFLMRKVQCHFPGSIRAIHNLRAGVTSQSAGSLQEFIHQRLRWASKWRANDSAITRIVAVFVWLVQVNWLVMPIFFFFLPLEFLIPLIGIKVLLEGFLLGWFSTVTGQPFYGFVFLALQLIYPVYVVYIGFASQFVSYRWKDRLVPAIR